MSDELKEDLRIIFKEELAPIHDRLNNIEYKVDGITNQVAKNAEDITDIKDNQKTIANIINKISSVQERQEQTIDLLARRSLDQEAELKRIK